MKIIAFGASTSRTSINKQLAAYAASFIKDAEVQVLDLNDFELPLFNVDIEAELGQPQAAKDFLAAIAGADALVISFAEHNGSYTAAYKNLFDWASRITGEVFAGKPAVYLSTSPGPGGAGSVLASAIGSAKFFAADVKASLSVPSFYDNFDSEANELSNLELKAELAKVMAKLG